MNRVQNIFRRKVSLCITVLIGVLIGEIVWLLSFRTSYDMEVYWDAYKALSAGEDPYAAVYGFHQLPLAGWLPGPFVRLGESWWPITWFLLMESCVIGGLVIASQLMGWSLRDKRIICLNLYMLASPPVLFSMRERQQAFIVFFLILLGIRLIYRNRLHVGGLFLGLGIALKPHLALVVLPLVSGWKVLILTLVGFFMPHVVNYRLLPSYFQKVFATAGSDATLGLSEKAGARLFILDLLPWGVPDQIRLVIFLGLIIVYVAMLAWAWKRRNRTIIAMAGTFGLLILPYSIGADWILLILSYWVLLGSNLVGLDDIWIRIALAMIWVNAVFVGLNNAYALLPLSVTPLMPLSLLIASIMRIARVRRGLEASFSGLSNAQGTGAQSILGRSMGETQRADPGRDDEVV